MIGWVKLHRKILESNMYKSLNSKQRDVMMAVLLMVNFEENEWEWEGEVFKCKPGQRVTSLKRIADLCGCDVKVQSVRTALLKLEKWGFLTNVSTKTGRLITVVNWDRYQSQNEVANKDTNRQLTKDQQSPNKELTTIKERRELEERKEEYILSENSDHTRRKNGLGNDKHTGSDTPLNFMPGSNGVPHEAIGRDGRLEARNVPVENKDVQHNGGITQGQLNEELDQSEAEAMGFEQEGEDGRRENRNGSVIAAGGGAGAKQGDNMENFGQSILEGDARSDSRGERKRGGQINDNLEAKANNPVKPAAKTEEGPRYRTRKKRWLKGARLDGFEQFWKVFDDKRSKAAAADSWFDLEGYSPELVKAILHGARMYAQDRQDILLSKGTPKMAQGWLTDRRWEDYVADDGERKGDGEIDVQARIKAAKERSRKIKEEEARNGKVIQPPALAIVGKNSGTDTKSEGHGFANPALQRLFG